MVSATTALTLADEYQTAVNMVKGTTFVPRDVLIAAAMGTLWVFHTTDGQTFESWRMTVPNVNDILEQLTNVPNALIMRGENVWDFILPGSFGQVLTMATDGPTWANPTGGGGGGGLTALADPFAHCNPYSTLSQASGWTQGAPLWCPPAVTITGIALFCPSASATPVLTPALYDDSAIAPHNKLAVGPTVTGVTQGFNVLPLTAPYTTSANELLWPCIAFATANCPTATSTSTPRFFWSGTTLPDPAPTASKVTGGGNAYVWPVTS